MSPTFKELGKSLISHISRHVDYWLKEWKKLGMFIAFNKKTENCVMGKEKHFSLQGKKKKVL